MAANVQKYLKKEGYPSLIVWNRTVSRADPLKDLGVVVSPNIDDAVKRSDIVFTTVESSTALSLTPACE